MTMFQISYVNARTLGSHIICILSDCDLNTAKRTAINYYKNNLKAVSNPDILISSVFINKISKYDTVLTNYGIETSIFCYP